MLRAAAKGQDSVFIDVRMRRAGELRAALRDPHWGVAPKLEALMRDILAYIDDSAGTLIPNDVPVVGLLDDAILIDAALHLLRGELDDFADFCRYRIAEAAHRNVAVDSIRINRGQWQVERRRELRLEQQLRRVRGGSFAAADVPEPGFRLC